jgi:hypothetical protein
MRPIIQEPTTQQGIDQQKAWRDLVAVTQLTESWYQDKIYPISFYPLPLVDALIRKMTLVARSQHTSRFSGSTARNRPRKLPVSF